MNKNIILCIAGFLLYLPIFSQEAVILKGIVIADSLNESAINIVNFTQKTGTTNNSSGEFQIKVKKSDTLMFSSVQYNLVEVRITEDILEKQFLQVMLIEKLNELGEVKISNISLSGNLEQDLKDMNHFSQADIGFPFSTKPAPTLMQRKMSGATNSPIELLVNTLNGRIKMLKKAQELMAFDALIDKGIEAVPTEFFVDDLHIPKEEIINFVNFCAEGVAYRGILTQGDHLKLMDFYSIKAPEFLDFLSTSIID